MGRLLAILFCWAIIARAEAPPNYYDSAAGLAGPELKSALHQIIRGHTVLPYADLIPPLRALWEAPGNPSNVQLIYGGTSVSKTTTTWNREHLWPRSRGVNPATLVDGGPDDSDLFHVVPADANVNSARSNRYFDLSSVADGGFDDPAHPEAPLCTRDANSWQPPENERGDIARALFYMAVRYDGSEPRTSDLELVTAAPTDAQMANLAKLLAWHAADPPDAAEHARNDLIYSSYQHNRNPFIDHPEWVSAIWGTLTGAPTVQVTLNSPIAVETPSIPLTLTVTLDEPAPSGGLTVKVMFSGTSSPTDYTISGASPDGMAYAVLVPAGARSANVTLTPVADGIAEAVETLTVSLEPNPGYDAIGGPVNATITDAQVIPRGVLASWNFDTLPGSGTIPANLGSGNISTAGWTGDISSFGGITGNSLALVGSAGNNSFIELQFSTSGWTNVRLGFHTRRNETGSFTNGTWSWSNDGVNFTTLSGVNTVANSTVFEARSLDLSPILPLQNASSVYLRYRLSGASVSMANNRLEDLIITGNRYSSAWLTRFPSFTGSTAGPIEDPDGDTLSNLTEWALDRNPLTSATSPPAVVGQTIAADPADPQTLRSWPTISFVRRIDTPNLLIVPEQSTDLRTWTGGCVLITTGAGITPQSESATYRATTPVSDGPVFFRLRVVEP